MPGPPEGFTQVTVTSVSVSRDTVGAAGRSFSGFNIVAQPTAGPDGIAWEFTGQMIVAMKLVDRLYAESRFGARAARTVTPMS